MDPRPAGAIGRLPLPCPSASHRTFGSSPRPVGETPRPPLLAQRFVHCWARRRASIVHPSRRTSHRLTDHSIPSAAPSRRPPILSRRDVARSILVRVGYPPLRDDPFLSAN